MTTAAFQLVDGLLFGPAASHAPLAAVPASIPADGQDGHDDVTPRSPATGCAPSEHPVDAEDDVGAGGIDPRSVRAVGSIRQIFEAERGLQRPVDRQSSARVEGDKTRRPAGGDADVGQVAWREASLA